MQKFSFYKKSLGLKLSKNSGSLRIDSQALLSLSMRFTSSTSASKFAKLCAFMKAFGLILYSNKCDEIFGIRISIESKSDLIYSHFIVKLFKDIFFLTFF